MMRLAAILLSILASLQGAVAGDGGALSCADVRESASGRLGERSAPDEALAADDETHDLLYCRKAEEPLSKAGCRSSNVLVVARTTGHSERTGCDRDSGAMPPPGADSARPLLHLRI
jgi:hypothetical protein